MSVSRTYGLVLVASASYTSPNMKKSSLPVARAWSMTCCVQDCQNSMFTCLTVSIRKPSIPKSTQSEKICAMPSTTTGFSVMRSSSAPKSPSVEDSPA